MIKYGFIVLGLVFAPQDIIAPGISGYLAASVSAIMPPSLCPMIYGFLSFIAAMNCAVSSAMDS